MSQDYPPTYSSAAPTNNVAVISLIVSILGLVGILPLVGSVAGIIAGRIARQEIARSDGTQSGEGLAQAGEVLGWIGLGLVVVGLCIGFLIASGVVGISLCAFLGSTQGAGWESILQAL
jgi:hypothetical protein